MAYITLNLYYRIKKRIYISSRYQKQLEPPDVLLTLVSFNLY